MSKHFKAYTTTFADCDEIDDCTQVYGVSDWPEIDDDCEKSPQGYHVFDCSPGSDPEVCVRCGRRC